MFSAIDTRWYLTHILCLLMCCSLVVTSFFGYARNIFKSDYASDNTSVLWASFVLGFLDFAGNLALFRVLALLEDEDEQRTIEEQFMLKRTTTCAGYVLNGLMACGGAAFAWKMVVLMKDVPLLMRVIGYIVASCALLSSATIVSDASKLQRERRMLFKLRIMV